MNYSMFWEVAVGIAGLRAIASFVFWSLYKKWLTLPFFTKLTKDQTFQLMRLFLIFSFAFSAIALGLYTYTKSLSADITGNTTMNQISHGSNATQISVNEGIININSSGQVSQELEQ